MMMMVWWSTLWDKMGSLTATTKVMSNEMNGHNTSRKKKLCPATHTQYANCYQKILGFYDHLCSFEIVLFSRQMAPCQEAVHKEPSTLVGVQSK